MKTPNALDTCASINSHMEQPPPEIVTPRKLPTPWLADSEWLLEELAKTRETVLRIPFRLDNASDIKSAIDRIWHLERTLRDLLHYHRDGQRSFVKQAAAAQQKASQTTKKATPKIVRLHA
jgi:hypothetical protein